MTHPNALVIMAKAPEGGDVKTRLSPMFNTAERVALYRQMLHCTVRRLSSVPGTQTLLAYSPDGAADAFQGYALPTFPQGGGDLGQRMHRIIKHTLAHGYERVAVVGADIPGLTTEIIQGALYALLKADVAIGPASDGGYYLIAMNRPRAEIFSNIQWSTDHVLSQTLQAARGLGLTVKIMEPLDDLDTPEDMERLNIRQ